MAKDQPKDAPAGKGASAPGPTPPAAAGVPAQPTPGPTVNPAENPAYHTPEAAAGRYDPLQSTGAAPIGPGEGQPPRVGRHAPEAPPSSGLPPRRPGFPRDKPFGVIHQRAPEQGGDVTLGTVAGLVRRFNDACRSRDFWEAARIAGLLLADLGESAGSFAIQSARPESRAAMAPHGEAADEFTAAARDFDQVKADVVSFSPQVHNLDWHRAGGAATGSPQPMGTPNPNAVRLNPQNLLTLVELVSQIIEMFRKGGDA